MSKQTIVFLAMTAALTLAADRANSFDFEAKENEYFDHSNDSHGTADPLFGDNLYPPSYYEPDDVDYYRLDVSRVPSELSVYVEGVDWLGLLGDPEAWLEAGSGVTLAYHDDIAKDVLNATFSFTFTVPGRYYVRVQHTTKTLWTYNHSNYYLKGRYGGASPVFPTYAGAYGITGAERIDAGPTVSAFLTWSPARDDETPPQQIRYNVYLSTARTDVFMRGPAASFVGVTQGRIDGLDPAKPYWFAVRAQDHEGHQETNAEVIALGTSRPTAVRPAQWMLYP